MVKNHANYEGDAACLTWDTA